MKKDAELKIGLHDVCVEYNDEGSNSIHVCGYDKGQSFCCDISLLTHQKNHNGGKWLENENGEVGAFISERKWEKIDAWLTAGDHY